jgi:hypothetical protein
MKLKKLFLLCTFALYALITTGCFDVGRVATLTFVQTPQSIYYVVGSEEAMAAQQEVLENVIVKVDDNEYTLKDLRDLLGATVEGLNLTDEGTHTLVIKFEGATLTYVYKVVTDLGSTLFAGGDGKTPETAYQIATPEQFMNMFTRVYGIPAPAKSSVRSVENEVAWKNYYQACFPFFTTGLHFKLTADLDFSGIEYKPLGAIGGVNYVPFTGVFDGNNKKIKNVVIDTVGDYAAIFAGITGSEIKNLTLDNISSLDGSGKYTAGLVAAALPMIYWNEESTNEAVPNTGNTITNVHLTNSIIAGTQRVGGLVTRMSSTDIENCSTDSNTRVIGLSETAGIVGQPIPTSKYSYMILQPAYGLLNNSNGLPTYNSIKNSTNSATIVRGTDTGSQLHNHIEPTLEDNIENGSLVLAAQPVDIVNYEVKYYAYISYYSAQGATATSSRMIYLGSNEEVLTPTAYLPYYPTGTDKITITTRNENVPEAAKDAPYYISGTTMYVNNSYFEYDIDGNTTKAYYAVSGTISKLYKVYLKNNQIQVIVQK